MVPVTKTNRSHAALMGWAPKSHQFCINNLISGNICTFEVYKGHMGQAILISRRNFSVNTDRYCRHMIRVA